jgi:hypothetical protein
VAQSCIAGAGGRDERGGLCSTLFSILILEMAGLYSPLSETREQIRLLTILSSSGIVQCRLETYGLDDFALEFQSFLSTSDTDLSTHQTTLQWTQRQSPSSSEPAKYVRASEPPSIHHRFQWGDFAALSYVWGDESVATPIVVNGHEMRVTRNLGNALREFREGEEFQGGFKLWIDAICINQADLGERAKQVRRMREIYGNAWAVIAWLGEGSRNSDAGIQLLRDLAALRQSGAGKEVAVQLSTNPEYLGKGCWTALQRLVERPYWYRLWVIQEMVMGASATSVRCGAASIDWTTFCQGVGFLQEYLWQVKDELLKHEATAGYLEPEDFVTMAAEGLLAPEVLPTRMRNKTVWTTTSLHLIYQDLTVLSESDGKGGDRLSFGRLLDLAHAAHCKDPKDKVYALVGLMDRSVASRISPNYTFDLSRVYSLTTRTFVESCDNLEPIREGNPWGPSNAPSWAADWQWIGRIRWSRAEGQIPGPRSLFPRAVPSNAFDVPFRASGSSKHDSSFSSDCRLLTCSGFIVDSISGLSACGHGYFAWDKSTIVQPESWTSVYGDVDATARALCRTLVLDRVEGGKRANDRHFAIFHLPSTYQSAYPQFRERGWTWLSGQAGYYFRWSRFREANKDFQLGRDRFDNFFDDQIPPDALEFDYSEVYACIDRSGKKRRLMTTRHGYLGWAPDNSYGDGNDQTRAGDLIAVLFGCSTPIVIRPHGPHFQVLGEAYVQGLMDGEAMELLDGGNFQSQRFTFC